VKLAERFPATATVLWWFSSFVAAVAFCGVAYALSVPWWVVSVIGFIGVIGSALVSDLKGGQK
jgi:hypothetical protein